jgi:hypothetical protein
MGAQLVLILSTSDRRLRKTVTQWKRIAVDTFRDEPEFSFEGEREAIVELFRTWTAELIQEANKLGLDPRPIQEFFTVVSAWNHEQSAPDRKHLRTMLEGALLVSDTVAAGIRRRAVRVHPADPSIPSITLPVPRVVAVEGPPIVLIPPLITDFISEWNATHTKVPEPGHNGTALEDPGCNGIHPKDPGCNGIALRDPGRNGTGTHSVTPDPACNGRKHTSKGRKHTKKGSGKLLLSSMLEALIESREWGLSDRQIALGAGVAPSTLSRRLKEHSGDKRIKELHTTYQDRGRGKRPPSRNAV